LEAWLRALISGGTGFVGTHLAGFLVEQGVEVFVFSPTAPREPSPRVAYFEADIRDLSVLRQICEETQPDEVYHLAAITSIADSGKDPRKTFDINVTGTYNLLEACMPLASRPRFLNVSTGQVYAVRGEPRLTEDCPVQPVSPYAATKAMAELLVYQYPRSQQERVVTTRPFNHSGPGQTADYVLSDFARQIAEMEIAVRSPVLAVGDLEVERDFTDVRDVVRAYVMLLHGGRGGEVYNVCSGATHRISSAVDVLQSLTSVRLAIQVAPDRARPGQPPRICGDPSKIQGDTGWRPTISWEAMLRDLLQHWRERVRQQAQSCSLS
jgi:GDP-4-dehydro-6-deoxy-D-mannose reductase